MNEFQTVSLLVIVSLGTQNAFQKDPCIALPCPINFRFLCPLRTRIQENGSALGLKGLINMRNIVLIGSSYEHQQGLGPNARQAVPNMNEEENTAGIVGVKEGLECSKKM